MDNRTLGELAFELKKKLSIPALRIEGDLTRPIHTIGFLPGARGGATQIVFAEKYQPDVLICGEVAVWEISEYFRDAITALSVRTPYRIH